MSEQNPEMIPSAPEREPAPRGHGVHREAHSGPRLWARARQAFFALPRGLHVVMLVIFMIVGFALATQVRAQRSDPLEGLSEQDLVTVLDELGTQEQNLRTRRGELSSELDELRSAADEAQAREQAARKAETQAQIAAGTVPVHGPGVTVSVVDTGANLTSTQFVMTLGELRNAGAEAIELNGVRLSTRSWISRLVRRPRCVRRALMSRSRRRLTSRSSRLRLRARPSLPPISEVPPYNQWGLTVLTVPALVGW